MFNRIGDDGTDIFIASLVFQSISDVQILHIPDSGQSSAATIEKYLEVLVMPLHVPYAMWELVAARDARSAAHSLGQAGGIDMQRSLCLPASLQPEMIACLVTLSLHLIPPVKSISTCQSVKDDTARCRSHSNCGLCICSCSALHTCV